MSAPTEGYIKMMESDLVKQVTVNFADLVKGGGDDDDGIDVTTRLLSSLNDLGVAIVADVLDEDSAATLEEAWAADLQSIVSSKLKPQSREMQFMKDPVNNWPSDKEEFKLGTKFATMYGLPHGQCAWGTRAHPNVRKVYEIIYGSNDLCVGLDNPFFNPKNSSVHPESKRVSPLWPHADQNSHSDPEGAYDVYQGVVYLWPATPDTSATVVWPGSNKSVYPAMMEVTAAKNHFCPLPKDQNATFLEAARRVPVPRGAMLLWNSRTIHQGWPHGKRLAVPVCFEPMHRRPADALKRKVEAVKCGKPTSHWASLGKLHTFSNLANGDKGGTQQIQLVHKSHLHALDDKGEVKDQYLKML